MRWHPVNPLAALVMAGVLAAGATACSATDGPDPGARPTRDGQVDPPTARAGAGSPVVSPSSPGDGSGFEALVGGTLELSGGCLLLGGYPVIWPFGTTWDARTRTVLLPSGRDVALGDRVRGAGGYPYLTDLTDDLAAPLEDCPTNEHGEVAAFNAAGAVTVLE